MIVHEINGCDPVLAMPCGHNVSLWVGGLDVKANFVPKIDIVGLVRIALLDGREPLFLKISQVFIWCGDMFFIIFEALLEAFTTVL